MELLSQYNRLNERNNLVKRLIQVITLILKDRVEHGQQQFLDVDVARRQACDVQVLGRDVLYDMRKHVY